MSELGVSTHPAGEQGGGPSESGSSDADVHTTAEQERDGLPYHRVDLM
jgi:hypothetical protein